MEKSKTVHFRPHACGVDRRRLHNLHRHHLSDPTPVGWMSPHKQVHQMASRFRPHACGVDIMSIRKGSLRPFQTPRLWGGWVTANSGVLVVFQTPRLWGGLR